MKTIIFSIVLLLACAYGYHERQIVQHLQGFHQPLKTIANQKFSNQVIPLDGNVYKNCTFENVTFRWHGAPYAFDNVHITGNRSIEVDGDVADVVYFLGALNLLDPQLNKTLHKLGK